MKYSYYPGCSVKGTNIQYDLSTQAVAEFLRMELAELKDWNCCGATAYMSVRELEAFGISARNLALAEPKNMDLVTSCNGCYTVLNKTNVYMKENTQLREKINEALDTVGLKYNGQIKVRHLLDVIVNDIGYETVEYRVVNKIKGLKLAPYYGCQLTRPYATFDDAEFPMTLDKLIQSLGGEPVNFPLKARCCGGMLMTTNEDIGLELVRKLFACAQENGAQCIVTICPLCQTNLELYQKKINRKYNLNISMPVIFFTQLMGVAFNLDAKKLGLDKEIVPGTEALLSLAK